MNRLAPVLIASILFVGCDAVSRTEMVVQATSTSTPDNKTVVTNVVSTTAKQFQLEEFKPDETSQTFTDSISRMGENPDIWLTVVHDKDGIQIRIWEMYIAHPTEQHKQLTTTLLNNLEAAGITASIVSQTSDATNWGKPLGLCVVVAVAFVVWRQLARRRPNLSKDFAT